MTRSVHRLVVRSTAVVLLAAAVATGASILAPPSPALAQEAPTVFDAPPPGGSVIGRAGTSDPAALAEAQPFEVESIWMRNPATGMGMTYWPDRPSSSNLNSLYLRPDSLVVIHRTPPPAPEPTPTPEPTTTPQATPPPAAEPPPSAAQSSLGELRPALQQALDANHPGGRVSLAVLDLQTGATVGLNEAEQRLAGCVLNLFVIMQAVLDVQNGDLALSEVDSLIRQTTWSSNAVTGRELYRIVGGGDVVAGVARVEDLVHSRLGLHDVVIDHPPGYGSESLGRNPNNWISGTAMNSAYATIWGGDLFDATHRAYLLEVLASVKPGLNYLTASVPATVSHKNGFFPTLEGNFVDNDAGIVRFEQNGQTYAYAVTMLFESHPEKYADIPLGQRFSALVWDWFRAEYR